MPETITIPAVTVVAAISILAWLNLSNDRLHRRNMLRGQPQHRTIVDGVAGWFAWLCLALLIGALLNP